MVPICKLDQNLRPIMVSYKMGDGVILKEDNRPALSWSTRVADIATAGGTVP